MTTDWSDAGDSVISRWRRRRPAEAQRDEPAVVVAAASDGPSVEEVYHDAALQFLNVQVSTSDVLDARTWQIFTVASTVLPLTFALLNLSTDQAPAEANWALGAALVCYILLILFARQANAQRLLEFRPDIATLREQAEAFRNVTLGGTVLREWVASEYQASIKFNRPLLASKGQWVGRMTAMLLVEGLSLAVAAILTLVL